MVAPLYNPAKAVLQYQGHTLPILTFMAPVGSAEPMLPESEPCRAQMRLFPVCPLMPVCAHVQRALSNTGT